MTNQQKSKPMRLVEIVEPEQPVEKVVVSSKPSEQLPNVSVEEARAGVTAAFTHESSPSLLKYLDPAMDVLKKYGFAGEQDIASQSADLLQKIVDVDAPRVLAIANILRREGAFCKMVRDKVQSFAVADRYADITRSFDSILTDADKMAGFLDDGKIDNFEKLQMMGMKLWNGSTHNRFEKIRTTYMAVTTETNKQLNLEEEIMQAYKQFRLAYKQADTLAKEVLQTQTTNLQRAKQEYDEASALIAGAKDDVEKSKREFTRDEKRTAFEAEDAKYNVIFSISNNMSTGYVASETIMNNVTQTHQAKQGVHTQLVSFYTTNETVFTGLDLAFTSQAGLNEATKSGEAMKDVASRGMGYLAKRGTAINEAAVRFANSPTLKAEDLRQLVKSGSDYQERVLKIISDGREATLRNTAESEKVYQEGQERHRELLTKYSPLFA